MTYRPGLSRHLFIPCYTYLLLLAWKAYCFDTHLSRSCYVDNGILVDVWKAKHASDAQLGVAFAFAFAFAFACACASRPLLLSFACLNLLCGPHTWSITAARLLRTAKNLNAGGDVSFRACNCMHQCGVLPL